MTDTRPARDLDTGRAHSARMYDYFLGGKDHFDVDRKAAERAAAVFPGAFDAAKINRAFMHRATRRLARDHGIRQWLDIGTGIPTEPNLHQVAQRVAPEARIVYADNDPLVLKYAETLMQSAPEGRTTYVEGDVTDPDGLLAAVVETGVLDLERPVALSLNALLHFVPDAADPYGIVARLVEALPSGSALAMTHATGDFDPEGWAELVRVYIESGTHLRVRTREEVARFYTGLDLIEPGIELVHRWHPEPVGGADDVAVADSVSLWCGVALKP